MPRTRDEKHCQSRKKEILDAATRCFVRRGLHKASMRQICREANLSSGAVYNYFESKDALIQGMADWEHEEIIALAAFLRNQGNAFDAVIAAVKQLVDEMTPDSARLFAELTAEASRNEVIRRKMTQNDAALQACLLDAIRRGQEEGTITRRLAADALLALVTVTYEGFVSRMAVEPGADKRQMVELTEYGLSQLLAA